MSQNRVRMTPSTDPRYPDKESQDIAEQLEKEGIKPLDGEPHTEDDESEEEEKPEPKQKPESKDESDEDEPEAKAEKGKENQEDDEEEDARPVRRQVLIPVARVKQEQKKLRDEYEGKISELTKQVANLQSQSGNGSATAQAEQADKVEKLTATAKAIAEKHDSDPALIEEILNAGAQLVGAKVELPKELTDTLATLSAAQKRRDEEENEKREVQDTLDRYDDEFATTFTASSDDGKAIAQEIRSSGLTLEQFKERLQDLALGEEGEKYAKLSLMEIFQLKKSSLLPKKAKSAEGSRGRTATGTSDSGDATELPSAEDIKDMTDAEFEKMSESLGRHSKPRITRKGKPV